MAMVTVQLDTEKSYVALSEQVKAFMKSAAARGWTGKGRNGTDYTVPPFEPMAVEAGKPYPVLFKVSNGGISAVMEVPSTLPFAQHGTGLRPRRADGQGRGPVKYL